VTPAVERPGAGPVEKALVAGGVLAIAVGAAAADLRHQEEA